MLTQPSPGIGPLYLRGQRSFVRGEICLHHFGAVHLQIERIVFAVDIAGPAVEPVTGGRYRLEYGFALVYGGGGRIIFSRCPIEFDDARATRADKNGQPEFTLSPGFSRFGSDQCRHHCE